ncbi:ABC transporter permease [Xanthobacter autotrophicus DSM 431]|uniref:ABC transporter permease n=1 Tax=Xanthobacter nonsaccharivorans TaxID=3119912 RepID=UPI003727C6CA
MSLTQTLDKPAFEAPALGGAAPDASTRRRARRRAFAPTPLGSVLLGLSFPLALLAAWWWAARLGLVPEQILPAPQTIYETAAGLIADGSLLTHLDVSARRVAVGFGLGALFGLVFGAAAGLSPTVRAFLYPPVQAVARVNVLAWMPLLTLFMGIDEPLKYVVIGWSAAIPIILGTARGIENVSPAFRELGRVLQFNTRDTLRLVVLPGAVPSIFAGLREGLANAWQTLVLAELFASFEGLGYLMTWGRQLFQLDLVIIAMIVVALAGLAMDLALRWVERRAQPWKRGTSDVH